MAGKFQRGSHPVGVTTVEWADAKRTPRRLTVEVWYPATPAHRGQDLDPATQGLLRHGRHLR